ncbi:alkaline phosphatase family protein [Virgibacillus sp. C22-A2]|uniref:Alkaline phosphatase family protein n=1 Tax=Virgibacillus tibetensis TaxID=3042313 RepID=A0ABU6KE20_9BACI|nr:alkaline phosphatase family protein [Virgibacillus sp. C22-A2]
MIKKIVITLLSIALLLFAINWYGFSTPTKDINSVSISPSKKPVVFLIIDSLMDEPMQKAMEEGRAPALTFLSEQGQYVDRVVSSYPTMSVTIDSTLLTGVYADKHQLPGLVWFNKEENRLISYGSGKMEIFHGGVKQVLKDSMSNLNQEHLSKNTATIYEDLDDRQIQSASINGLVYRGNQKHNLHVPRIASAFNLLPKDFTVKGPTLFSMGSLSQYSPDNNKHNRVWQDLGMNDAFTAEEITYLIQNESLPSFTLGYFPDLDHPVHENGPAEINGIEQIDQHLQTILDAFPTWEDALENMTLIVYGDSGQAIIGEDRNEAIIDLPALFEMYQLAELGELVKTKDQLALAVNERMAYIHLLDDNLTYMDLVSDLMDDPRIGFIAWKDEEKNYVTAEGSNQLFTFQPDGNFTDPYNQTWGMHGDLSILDLSTNDKNEMDYGEYPDALARLHGALHSHKGRFLIVDAKPGYEFIAEHSPTHVGGGGHGSLHAKDSLTPLLITGTDTQPAHKRAVDFKAWLLELIE